MWTIIKSDPSGAVHEMEDDPLTSGQLDQPEQGAQDYELGASYSTLTQNDLKEIIQPIFKAINEGDLKSLTKEIAADVKALNSSRCMGLAPIHAAVETENIEILQELLNSKVLISTLNLFGNTALHVAATRGWHEGVKELLDHGASPDKMTELPSTLKEVVGETPLHIAVRRGDLQSAALMMRCEPDLTICDTRQYNLLHLAAASHSLPIITRLLQETQCQKMIQEKNYKGNNVLHSALGLKVVEEDVEFKIMETVKSLIEAGADVNSINNSGETPLYRAAFSHLPEIVKLLLKYKADPTTLTVTNKSVIHAACTHGCSESLIHLFMTGKTSDYISHLDNDGNEPFHLAIKSCSISCCEVLLQNGDHLTKTDDHGMTRFSLILERLPTATQLIRSLLDKHISITKISRHDPDFKVTFDYSPLLAPKTEKIQCSVISELSLSKLEVLFKHPLIESFLRIKWRRISLIFYIPVVIYFLFLIIHTVFVLTTYGLPLKKNSIETLDLFQKASCLNVTSILFYNSSSLNVTYSDVFNISSSLNVTSEEFKNSSCLNFPSKDMNKEFVCDESSWYNHRPALTSLRAVYVAMYILIIVPELSIVMTNVKKFLSYWDIYVKLFAYVTSIYVVFSYNLLSCSAALSTERPVAAISAIFSWAVFMLQLSRLPALGVYILMFTHVAKSMVKMLLAFSSLIIGFAVSFQILYRDHSVFDNFLHSFVKTLMMMIGEINYIEMAATETNSTTNVTLIIGSILLMLFLFSVTVLMMNILIGVAVHDVPVLQREGNIRHLSKRASFLVAYEKTLLYLQSITFFPEAVLQFFARPCYINPKKEVYPNKYRKNHRSAVPSETIEEAIAICSRPVNEENIFIDNEDEDPIKLFKTFQVLYFRDKKTLNRSIKSIANECKQYSSIKEQLQLLHKKLDQQNSLIYNLIASQRNSSHINQVLSTSLNEANTLVQAQQYPQQSNLIDQNIPTYNQTSQYPQ